jgi:hypothetical protein
LEISETNCSGSGFEAASTSKQTPQQALVVAINWLLKHLRELGDLERTTVAEATSTTAVVARKQQRPVLP